jgi:hypothetical protein
MLKFEIKDLPSSTCIKILTGPGRDTHVSLEALLVFFKFHKDQIELLINQGNAIYFKDFPINSAVEFGKILKTLNNKLIPYTGAKVRSPHTDDYEFLYSPTSTPNFRKNFLHNEMAYKIDIPAKIALYCEIQAPIGGESILGDQRQMYLLLSSQTRKKLEEKKLKFVRFLINEQRHHSFLSKKFDLLSIFPSWQNNFQTTDKKLVEQKCKEDGYEVEWTNKGHLLIWTIIEPIKYHPVTKEKIWVNNAHVFQLHKDVFGPWIYYLFTIFFWIFKLPKTTCYYGDGSKLEDEVVKEILTATATNEKEILMTPGDFIYANNQTISHGRQTFKGPRKLFFSLLE